MNSFRKLTAAAFAVGVLVFVCTGCGSSGSGGSESGTGSSQASSESSQAESSPVSSEKKKIFVFAYFPFSFNDGTRAWGNGFEKAKEELGSRAEIVFKAEGTLDLEASTFLNFIKSAMVEEPDGIVVIPNNAKALEGGLQQLQSQTEVPIVNMDQPMENVKKVAFVGSDNEKVGAQAAEYLIEQFEANQLPSNEVAILTLPPGGNSDARLLGFENAIEASPLKVVATTEFQGEDAEARTDLADIFTAHPNVGGIFTQLGYGGASLIASQHPEVQQVSIDASKEGIELVENNGGLNAMVAQHYENMADVAVTTLVESLEGKSVPSSIDSGTTVVTAKNAKQYLKQVERETRK